MKKFYFLLLGICCLYSCSATKGNGISIDTIPSYINRDGSRNLYIVDTIKIPNPVLVLTDEGYEFTMSRSVLDEYNGEKRFFFSRPDVYLTQHSFPIGVDLSGYGNLKLNSPDSLEPVMINAKGIKKVLSYSNSNSFLFVLINGDYYRFAYGHIGGPRVIDFGNNKFVYYKVVVPFLIE